MATSGVGDVGSVEPLLDPARGGRPRRSRSGRIHEAISALIQRRPRRDLYHAALEVNVPKGRFVIEMAPGPDISATRRGALVQGPVGMRWLGRFRLFATR